MNLAVRDIQHNLGRFVLTTLGVAMLLMIVMGMAGIYQGLVYEATLLVDRIGADVWVVQRDTRGPFAEISRVPRNLVDRVSSVPGIRDAREFVYHTIQRQHQGKSLRVAVLGLAWPKDKGAWVPLVAGRALQRNHYEMVADGSLGLALGERIRLGKDTYRVVGLTQGITDPSGNGFAFFTLADAQAIQFDVSGEATRLERDARRARTQESNVGRTEPSLLERASGPSTDIPVLPGGQISAVLASYAPGANPRTVLATLGSWPDVSVHTREDENDLLVLGVVDKARRQLWLFRVLLTIISGVIMALILYTLTLDKLRSIAIVKLIGGPNRVIVGMIMQQSLALGGLGYLIGYAIGQKLFPMFPRRVILNSGDLVQLAFVVVGISVLASLLGVWKAMRVSPNEALATTG
jgi:putative ABC transport system permease protein